MYATGHANVSESVNAIGLANVSKNGFVVLGVESKVNVQKISHTWLRNPASLKSKSNDS